ncbi:cytochrome P450 [Pararhodobacter zhoushanensis]|uniref:Cytochrome P450 n=1 Tax=Pararhodobacter zhoushanensis TaxID=2479545 RepID=A0ABT3GXK5_9RHOB|nr:cytochrome P450 [Pararhodobacter zhoushanensis]MCW1932288.1 cytochrome P450 [Pararhodobacter zhoushanensis]
MARELPKIDDVSLTEMYSDPYPTYARLRRDAPVSWLVPAGIALITRFDDIIAIERDHETFPANDPRSLQIRSMGHTLMRRDGAEHAAERSAMVRTFSPPVVKGHWEPVLRAIVDEQIAAIAGQGQADLFNDFCAPVASRALAQIIGLPDVDWRDMLWWSQALIDATGNYGDLPEPWEHCARASAQIDAAIEAQTAQWRREPDPSALSAMVAADWPVERTRANIKVAIGGGLNEPRDAIGTLVLGLLGNPDQLAAVRADPKLNRRAFEESVRWVAPIGLYPRRVARDVVLSETLLPAGTPIGLSAGSACRDEAKFGATGEVFDMRRPQAQHLAFGSGPHFCLGAWMARLLVGEIAVPSLFERLPGLRLDPQRPHRMGGWVFRGPVSLPVLWDA